jgi:hypothetical protein
MIPGPFALAGLDKLIKNARSGQRLKPRAPASRTRLFAQFQLFGDRLVTIHVLGVEIIQQPAPLADHHQQSPAGAVIFEVFLQMFGQVVDPLRQQRDLNVRRTGIPVVYFEIFDCFRFRFHTCLRACSRLLFSISSAF